MANNDAPIRVALLGAGTVGSQTARLLVEQADELTARVGRPMQLVGIATLDPVEAPWIDQSIVTDDASELVTRADIVIELIGGIEPARTFILKAIENGASVVTANKALLAKCGPEIYKAAEDKGVDIYFEAAVGGAIPIVRPLRESMVGDRINRIMGIVNGTTNYILDEMTTKGLDFGVVLKAAQEAGFAEANPTADIDGLDAASKAAIMACLAFHRDVRIDDVHVEGIRNITSADIAAAKAMHRVIKLLAVVKQNEKDEISAGVYPIMLPETHQLAKVGGSFNAVFVEGEASDDLMFYGRGAGGAPTASAVVGDVVTEARHRVAGTVGPDIPLYSNAPILDAADETSSYMLRMSVYDKPGVLAVAAQIFAQNNVSIKTVQQVEAEGADGTHELWVICHPVTDRQIRAVADSLEKSTNDIKSVLSVIRVFDEN
ncbi:MAG: homoserine dehydrogenase [Bifidobacteriaceae bacterium]|nr:homoserine dehydrogenase [Bifidobacteriaceae bacterium]